MNSLAGSMLQGNGNMRTPAILDAAMCGLDVLFNLLFIRYFGILGLRWERHPRRLRDTGDTLVPCILNLASIWGIRLTLSILLAGQWGLIGVWFAMCMELCVRAVAMPSAEK